MADDKRCFNYLFFEPLPLDQHIFICELRDDQSGVEKVFLLGNIFYQFILFQYFINWVKLRMWWSCDVVFLDPGTDADV